MNLKVTGPPRASGPGAAAGSPCLLMTMESVSGPSVRAENSNTPRHLAEFWMIEPEMAFYELKDDMELAEAFLKRIIKDALAHCSEDLKFFQERIDKEVFTRLENVINNPFLRVSYTDAVDILLKSGQTWEYPVAWGNDLQSEHERFLTEKHFKSPVILYNYPRTLKPFYMRVNDDGKKVAAMDVLVPGVGEIIGGSQREERLDILDGRMREQGLDPAAYRWDLDLRRFRGVRTGGPRDIGAAYHEATESESSIASRRTTPIAEATTSPSSRFQAPCRCRPWSQVRSVGPCP
jgi:asparaginyl-tRNA synthetase